MWLTEGVQSADRLWGKLASAAGAKAAPRNHGGRAKAFGTFGGCSRGKDQGQLAMFWIFYRKKQVLIHWSMTCLFGMLIRNLAMGKVALTVHTHTDMQGCNTHIHIYHSYLVWWKCCKIRLWVCLQLCEFTKTMKTCLILCKSKFYTMIKRKSKRKEGEKSSMLPHSTLSLSSSI